MDSHDVHRVIAHLVLPVASFALGSVLIALDTAPLDPLPAIAKVDLAPAQVAGLARPAAGPKLVIHESKTLRSLEPKAFDDQLPLPGSVGFDAALGVSLRQRVVEIAVEEICGQSADSPGVFGHTAQRSADE
jgi:hypothetical protein